MNTKLIETPWSESASEQYRPNCRLSAKLVPTFSDRGCSVVNVTDSYICILGFLDLSRYFFFKVAPLSIASRKSYQMNAELKGDKLVKVIRYKNVQGLVRIWWHRSHNNFMNIPYFV
jgi:hypothetical protein